MLVSTAHPTHMSHNIAQLIIHDLMIFSLNHYSETSIWVSAPYNVLDGSHISSNLPLWNPTTLKSCAISSKYSGGLCKIYTCNNSYHVLNQYSILVPCHQIFFIKVSTCIKTWFGRVTGRIYPLYDSAATNMIF